LNLRVTEKTNTTKREPFYTYWFGSLWNSKSILKSNPNISWIFDRLVWGVIKKIDFRARLSFSPFLQSFWMGLGGPVFIWVRPDSYSWLWCESRLGLYEFFLVWVSFLIFLGQPLWLHGLMFLLGRICM